MSDSLREKAEQIAKDLPDLLTTKELMSFFRVSRTTVFKWIKDEKKFPGAFQIDTTWRIPRQDVVNLAYEFYKESE